jgi:hypothetical protein
MSLQRARSLRLYSHRQRPLWVKNGSGGASKLCLRYPTKQTSTPATATSVSCQEATCAAICVQSWGELVCLRLLLVQRDLWGDSALTEPVVDIENVVVRIRKRASMARISSILTMLLLTGIGTVTAYFFLEGSSGPLFSIGTQSNLSNANISAEFGGVAWISEITRAFVRIGAVIMDVFVINILVSFSRYNMRVANYLDSRADCLLISNGDYDVFASLLPALSVDPLDFINTPMNPYDSYLETIRSMMPGSVRAAAGRPSASKPAAKHGPPPQQED